MNLRMWQERAKEIEREARRVQVELWKAEKDRLGYDPPNPLALLEPAVALRKLGYRVETVETLGVIGMRGKQAEVAGELDRGNEIVRISNRFPQAEILFTAAHEVGHIVLEHRGDNIHRDRPLDPAGWNKDPQEREADYFAACFRMPRLQLEEWFQKLFYTDRFELDDATAFALCPKSPEKVINRCRTLRDLTLLLSGVTSYNGRQVRALIEVFGVSHSSMAIRLEQLDLVAEPRFARRVVR